MPVRYYLKKLNKYINACPVCGHCPDIAKDDYGKYFITHQSCFLYFGIKLEDGVELVDGWKAIYDSPEAVLEAWNN